MSVKFANASGLRMNQLLSSAKEGILLVAVTDIEKGIVLNQMSSWDDGENEERSIIMIPHNSNTYYLGRIGVQKIVLLVCGMGAVGKNSVMNKVHEAINDLSPKVLIMVGIAFGLDKEKQKIGDVLISQKIIAYENQKITPKTAIPRGEESQSGTILFDRLKNAEDWEFKLPRNRLSKRHFGAILSGEKLFDNKPRIEELKKRYPEAIGGEMEGYGISSVAGFKGISEWIIIKGICDWGYDKQTKNKEVNQRNAMRAAMSLCSYLFSNELLLSRIVRPSKNGIAKKKSRKNKAIKNKTSKKEHFNSYKMFYYRTKINDVKIKDLKTLTGISADKLRRLEKIDTYICGDDIAKFPVCYANERRAIEKALKIRSGGLIINKKDIEVGVYKSYYEKNKGLTPSLRYKKIKKDAKIVVFDFDGTIVDAHALKTTWEKIWLELGYDVKKCKELHERFDRHEFSHQEWCDKTASFFKEKNMSQSVLENVAKSLKIVPGFHNTIKELKNNNVKLFIVSGSICELIMYVLKDTVKDFESIDANRFVFSKDGVLERIIGTEFDFDGKAKRITKISMDYDVPPDEILFIGNSFNDAHVYQSGARTLCVNPTKTNSHNQLYWNDSIDELRDFSEILPFVFPSKERLTVQ